MTARYDNESLRKQVPVGQTETLERWATALQRRGLANIAVMALDVLQVWGFVGGQLLWMLEPFCGNNTLTTLAETLEQPEVLRALQAFLLKEQVKL
jgi:hypothetical protein